MGYQVQRAAKFLGRSASFFSAILALALFAGAAVPRAEAQDRLVVRDTLGLRSLLNLCNVLGCSVEHGLGDPDGQLFLVKTPRALDVLTLQLLLKLNLGVVSVEVDQSVSTLGAEAGAAPYYLSDRTPVNYYGSTVWHGYVTQPANQLIRTSTTQSKFNSAGSGVVVAVIDTGVDTSHPALKSSLVPGYDFTRNHEGADEKGDVTQSTVAVVDFGGYNRPSRVSQSTVAVVDQSTVAVVDNPEFAAFGHGTMVSGLVHLVAPQAQIMPLKSFQADGSGYHSDILRAIYYAVDHGAKVINMSFHYGDYSEELEKAVNYATNHGVICVAAAGNSGVDTKVYPGALKNVIDVASTDENDIQSSFTNYGAPPIWLAAPGEGVMTTYPFGTYAAGWGTSFSAPLVSGTAAMMAATSSQTTSQTSLKIGTFSLSFSLQCSLQPPIGQSQAANALAHAQDISAPDLGNGRLDTYQAMQAWRANLGLR